MRRTQEQWETALGTLFGIGMIAAGLGWGIGWPIYCYVIRPLASTALWLTDHWIVFAGLLLAVFNLWAYASPGNPLMSNGQTEHLVLAGVGAATVMAALFTNAIRSA